MGNSLDEVCDVLIIGAGELKIAGLCTFDRIRAFECDDMVMLVKESTVTVPCRQSSKSSIRSTRTKILA